ncbi:MAG: DUF2760 domain-containing protein [Planctomycetaceae bacterium]
MGRLGLAVRVLFNGDFARQVAELAAGSDSPARALPEPAVVAPVAVPAPPKPSRSDAVTLLATLQREARLLDFFKEGISEYTDAQIGAAVRDLHRQTNAVLERIFAVRPLLDAAEGSSVSVPANADASVYQLTGNVGSGSPGQGTLMHHGWKATQCDLPRWSGSADSSLVIAPAEVEV